MKEIGRVTTNCQSWISRWPILAIGLMAGCGEPVAPAREPAAPPSFELLVSNPVAVGGAPGQPASGNGATVYVSVAPATVPNGDRAVIENQRTHVRVTTPVTGGGFDPVAVAAEVGDTLRVVIHHVTGDSSAAPVEVPPRRGILIVRTDPAPGMRDVPLNPTVIAIMSEPINLATVNSQSVRLRRSGEQVAVTVGLVPGSPWAIQLAPTSPLEPETPYELVITTDLRDLDGEGLGADAAVPFTTGTDEMIWSGAPRLAFVSTRDGGGPVAGRGSVPWIYLASGGGYGGWRLAQGESPAWSPDGLQIAFHRWDGGASGIGQPELVVSDGTRSGLRVLVRGGMSPSWSPDGTQITYHRWDGTAGVGIYIVNATGTPAPRKLVDASVIPDETHAVGSVLYPSWGTGISFVRTSATKPWVVYLMEADGTDLRVLPLPFSAGDSRPMLGTTEILLQLSDRRIASFDQNGSGFRLFATGGQDPDWYSNANYVVFAKPSGPATQTWPQGTRMRIYLAEADGPTEQLVPEAVNPVEPEYWDTQPTLARRGVWDYSPASHVAERQAH